MCSSEGLIERVVDEVRAFAKEVQQGAAEKVKVDKLLTFNVRHFRWVWPEGGDIIQEP